MYGSIDEFLHAWISDMRSAFPELEENFNSLSERSTHSITKHLKKTIEKHSEKLSAQDESLFQGEDAVDILPGISFKYIWSTNPSDNTKSAIWKYIAIAMVYTIMGDMIFQMKDMSFDDISTEGGMGEMFGEVFENYIGDAFPKELLEGKLGVIAKEIMGKINPEMFGISKENMSFASLKGLMERKDEITQQLMGIVQDTIKQKIDSGEMTEAELKEEIEKFQETFKKLAPKMMGMFGNMANMGHEERAALDPRRQKIIERLKKKHSARTGK